MDVKDKSGVGEMFNKIAYKYDFLNHFLTLNIDRVWRRSAVKQLHTSYNACYLDVASGTGDLAIAIAKTKQPLQIVGVDISKGMLNIGCKKVKKLGYDQQIIFQQENCEALSFENNRFDAATIGFGIRNFQNPVKALEEIHRVLKLNGELVILEFSRPKWQIIRWLYGIYFLYILPFIGKMFSKHTSAYAYLPKSVMQFPYGENFSNIMRSAGFKDVECKSLTFGIVMIYRGVKNNMA